MNRLTKISLGFLAVFALIGYTRVIWLSGFDIGSDVSLCVVASYQQGPNEKTGKVELADNDPSCKRVEEYKSNPLWLLRRR